MPEFRHFNTLSEVAQGQKIAQEYFNGLVTGWGGKDLAEDAFKALKGPQLVEGLPSSMVKSAAGRKMFLYQVNRKVLGKDTPNYPQQIGDCVSFGAKNATEYVTCTEILMKGERQKFRPVFPPYYYGTGRIYVGGGQMGNSDGSTGAWMAKAVMQYGTLFADESGVPAYAGNVAKSWGGPRGKSELDKWKPTAEKFPVKSAALIRSWEELVAAVVNGYPCTIASNQGFRMEAGSDGFHAASGQWSHQMCCEANTLIKKLTSPTTINNIKVGDEVVCHDGKLHKVTEVFKREYAGKLYEIKFRGGLPLKVTPNHPILVLREDNNSYEESATNGNVLLALKKKVKTWVNAEDVKVGDYLVCPAYINTGDEVTLPKWEASQKCRNKPNDIVIDDDIAWLFGLYTADGSAAPGHRIRITLGEHETEIAARAVKALTKLGLKSTITPIKNKKAIRVTAYSSVVANSFIKWFGKQENKQLPDWIFNGWNLREVLNGVFAGDGNLVKNRKNLRRIVNTSRILIEQLHTILLMLGEKPSITNRVHKSDYAKNWKPIYVIEWNEDSNKQEFNYWKNNDFCMKVYEINKIDHSDYVYNFEVEDAHSYIANGVVVHNCIIAVDDEYSTPYALILNNWGDVHGHLKSFDGNEDLPLGVIRAKRSVIERIINAGETFAFSSFEGFPEQDLEEKLFDPISG